LNFSPQLQNGFRFIKGNLRLRVPHKINRKWWLCRPFSIAATKWDYSFWKSLVKQGGFTKCVAGCFILLELHIFDKFKVYVNKPATILKFKREIQLVVGEVNGDVYTNEWSRTSLTELLSVGKTEVAICPIFTYRNGVHFHQKTKKIDIYIYIYINRKSLYYITYVKTDPEGLQFVWRGFASAYTL